MGLSVEQLSRIALQACYRFAWRANADGFSGLVRVQKLRGPYSVVIVNTKLETYLSLGGDGVFLEDVTQAFRSVAKELYPDEDGLDLGEPHES